MRKTSSIFFRTFFVLSLLLIQSVSFSQKAGSEKPQANPPIYIAFLWHMHQPIYWPYESVVQTDANGRFPFSVTDIHNQRLGPYNSWPKDAVQKGINANMPHFGAQVSFSGSLVENLNALQANGNGNFSNWKSHWNSIKNQMTSLGNPRMDMVGFGYFHPLMGLIDYNDIRKQIQWHKQIFSSNFPGPYSKGIFPPENAFVNRMIPALADEGLNWVLVDNVHFDRSAQGYPFNTGGNIYEPNKADVLNSNPNDWLQLQNIWAPTKVSAAWGHRPHYVEYVNPNTGQKSRIIAIPASRYLGNEDGRGGFGALNYESVMSQFEQFNTDPQRPILIVLHHDGDNYGGGSDSYYGSNFQNFVNWLQANPSRFVCTTIEDYLEMFPPDQNAPIHIESGSWSGADNGDPEFKKWLGDPGTGGYSPDINSWGVLTAAQNHVHMAENIDPAAQNTYNAWKYLLVSESSDYWYWDGSLGGIWDSNPTRGANQAVNFANMVIGSAADNTAPTVFILQREPYNPGATEWNQQMPSDFKVWTYAYDVRGLSSVKLYYREDLDGVNSLSSVDNETYAGGAEVGNWTAVDMTGIDKPSLTNPAPVVKAKEYSAMITGISNKLLDYYVEAIDVNNNVTKTAIQHVWVGAYTPGGSGGTGTSTVTWLPSAPTKDDTITVTITKATQGAKLHWGVNPQGSNWTTPNQAYWPANTTLFNGTGPAVETVMAGPSADSLLTIKIGPFNNAAQSVDGMAFVIHYNDNTWNNNNGQDFKINFQGGGGGTGNFVVDGTLDAGVTSVATSSGANLYLGWKNGQLYVATQSAQSQGKDVFIMITDSLRASVPAMWGKSGTVPGWSLFLGNESTNNWSGWSDASSNPTQAAGQVLEGVVNVQSEFGYLPSKLYIAVLQYATADGGALQNQVPAGNGNANVEPGELYQFDYTLTSVKEINLSSLQPENYGLGQNYPNPFNPSTSIRYALPAAGNVEITLYNPLGQKVTTLVDEYKPAGTYEVKFDAGKLTSGVYFYTMTVNGYRESRKMILNK